MDTSKTANCQAAREFFRKKKYPSRGGLPVQPAFCAFMADFQEHCRGRVSRPVSDVDSSRKKRANRNPVAWVGHGRKQLVRRQPFSHASRASSPYTGEPSASQNCGNFPDTIVGAGFPGLCGTRMEAGRNGQPQGSPLQTTRNNGVGATLAVALLERGRKLGLELSEEMRYTI